MSVNFYQSVLPFRDLLSFIFPLGIVHHLYSQVGINLHLHLRFVISPHFSQERDPVD